MIMTKIQPVICIILIYTLTCCCEGRKAAKSKAAESDLKVVESFTDEELSRFDGSDPKKPIYLAVKGVVFDVSAGKDFYGKGKAYNALAGKDASRGIALWSLQEKDLTADVTDLTDEQLKDLDKIFKDVYKAKYPVVGFMNFGGRPLREEL